VSARKVVRVSIGFAGGQVLPARVTEEALEELARALRGSGWHDLPLEDGTLAVELGQVAYVRVESDEPRVGFGA